MKKQLFILLMFCVVAPISWATEGSNQHFTPEQFREKQKAYITDKAELTKAEAESFFPVYFELQDKKKELNDKIRRIMKSDNSDRMTEAQYGDIVDEFTNIRIQLSELEKTYTDKFKKIISNKKIYMVQKAEHRFHRDLLKGIHKGNQRGKK